MVAMELREYQRDCVEQARLKNSIINLPTGLGKTLIAVRVIDHCLEQFPHKNVLFIVPTRPLVGQQARYCRDHCQFRNNAKVAVAEVSGSASDQWARPEWEACLNENHVVVGTPAIFQQLLITNRYVPVSKFCLIVFDECHGAVGNSPMASIMRDAVAPYYHENPGSEDLLRILGLTASFVNGSLKDMEDKKRKLEALLISTIVCPDVESRLDPENFERVSWDREEDRELHEKRYELVIELAQQALTQVDYIDEVKKVAKRCGHIFEELGRDPLVFYSSHAVGKQVLQKAKMLQEKAENIKATNLGIKLAQEFPKLELAMQKFVNNLRSSDCLVSAHPRSAKLERLIDLIKELFPVEEANDARVLLFVEQVALVSPLAHELNNAIDNLKVGAVAGGMHQRESDREEQLEKFRCGEIQVLVSTPTLEEGTDVPECRYVIRFTQVSTTKAHIQGSGRARHKEARIFLFENEPLAEHHKATLMTAVARDTSLSLGPEFLASAATRMTEANTIGDRHPYPVGSAASDNGQVSVFTATKIFNEYCSICLKKTLSPKKDLYVYDMSGDRRVISFVKYPTPYGWRALTEADSLKFWEGIDSEKVFSGRPTKKTRSQREEMLIIYTIVVSLREEGYLTSSNRPDTVHATMTKRMCPALPTSDSGILIRDVVLQPGDESRRCT